MQYTLRNVPETLDAALRRRASRRGQSLNEAALEALAEGLGMGHELKRRRDLREFLGSWVTDPETERALEGMRVVDPELWR